MAEQHFTLSSPAWPDGGLIPSAFTCDGDNVSPHLQWLHAPPATRSFALIVDDPDAPGGTFTHWVLFDIPGDVDHLAQNDRGIGVAGRNDFQGLEYAGPCPPPHHDHHRYYFRLFALDTDSLDLPEGATRQQVEQAMKGHILDTAELMGRYRRGAH